MPNGKFEYIKKSKSQHKLERIFNSVDISHEHKLTRLDSVPLMMASAGDFYSLPNSSKPTVIKRLVA